MEELEGGVHHSGLLSYLATECTDLAYSSVCTNRNEKDRGDEVKKVPVTQPVMSQNCFAMTRWMPVLGLTS